MDKKGELTTTQIVMIIVLIVSFIVILYFIFRLNLGATSNSEICHNSVVINSKSSGVFGGVNCATDYVCISAGGKCDNMNPTTTVSVSTKDKNEIMKTIGDEMVTCWWMFGEGQTNYAPPNTRACGVCSIIGFDNNLQKAYPNGISYKDLLDYFSTNTTNQDGQNQTYLNYLYGISSLQTLLAGSPPANTFYNSMTISFSSQYSVITGSSKSNIFQLFSNGPNLRPVLLAQNQISANLGNQCDTFVTKS